jgi:NAD(P)H-hydrate epimerase
MVPARPADGHKGTFGTLVCVCGSLEYAGAALLCGTSAMRAGAGLVALAVPASLQPVIAGRVPELVTVPLPEDGGDVVAGEAVKAIDKRAPDALVVGSGLRESPGNGRLVRSLIKREGVAAVVDGGALNLLAAGGEWWPQRRRSLILTPHPGEFARLTGAGVGSDDAERAERAADAALRFESVVVLKGARTVVADSTGRLAVTSVANAALATAGSGDVLAGVIGSLLAQGAPPFDAACLGVYLHARSGERLSGRMGTAGVLASDIGAEIPFARHELVAHSS